MVFSLSNLFVFLGILILLGSLFSVRGIISHLPDGRSRKCWVAMGCLIVLFVLGYMGYLYIFWKQQTAVLDLVVPGVFFFGACFVWLSTYLSLQTARDIIRINILEKDAFIDPLTGVYNRRYMEQSLNDEIAKAQRYKLDLSLLILDLDYFKLINDQYGHQFGDQILAELSFLMDNELRDSDILSRYGGEEFLAIAPNTTHADAFLLAERIRKKVESHRFSGGVKSSEPFEINITISIGVSCYGGSITSKESLIHNADNNLYIAKEQGRNKVVASHLELVG